MGRLLVEMCEKLRRLDGQAMQRNVPQGEVYRINGAAATVEMRACSACGGDYEDPDRTAWAPDDEEEEERNDALVAALEEFPAEDK
jgi:hypothetical protein